MWVVMQLEHFNFEPLNSPLPVKVETGNLCGYLPVYENREDAEREYPDIPIQEIRFKSK